MQRSDTAILLENALLDTARPASLATRALTINAPVTDVWPWIVQIGQDSPAADFGRPHPDLPVAPLPRPYAASEDN